MWSADQNGDIRNSEGVLIFRNYSGHGKTTAAEQKAYADLVVRLVNANFAREHHIANRAFHPIPYA